MDNVELQTSYQVPNAPFYVKEGEDGVGKYLKFPALKKLFVEGDQKKKLFIQNTQ